MLLSALALLGWSASICHAWSESKLRAFHDKFIAEHRLTVIGSDGKTYLQPKLTSYLRTSEREPALDFRKYHDVHRVIVFVPMHDLIFGEREASDSFRQGDLVSYIHFDDAAIEDWQKRVFAPFTDRYVRSGHGRFVVRFFPRTFEEALLAQLVNCHARSAIALDVQRTALDKASMLSAADAERFRSALGKTRGAELKSSDEIIRFGRTELGLRDEQLEICLSTKLMRSTLEKVHELVFNYRYMDTPRVTEVGVEHANLVLPFNCLTGKRSKDWYSCITHSLSVTPSSIDTFMTSVRSRMEERER